MANENNPSMKLINQFHDDHKWRQFHNAKDLALSVSIEAAELLEIFQWTDPESVVEKKREDIEEELADVLIYCYTLAEKLNICLLYTSPSPRDPKTSRMPSSA